MDAARLNWLTATETARLIEDGAIKAEDHVRACIARIEETEPTVQAWAHFEAEDALNQARDADVRRMRGLPCGLLHGVAVGIKDIIDVRGLPTEDGTVLHAGRRPAEDATAVALLREEEVAGLSTEDGAATLTAFTADCVAASLRHMPSPPTRWLVCGGGRKNGTIMRMLAERLGAPVDPVEAVGLDGDMLEAQAFAYLAVRVLRGLPTSAPSTTGCRAPVCGGRISYL